MIIKWERHSILIIIQKHSLKVEYREKDEDGHGKPFFFLARQIKGIADSFDVIRGKGIVMTEQFGPVTIYSEEIINFNPEKIIVENKWNRSVNPGEQLILDVAHYKKWNSNLNREIVELVAVNVTGVDGNPVKGHQVSINILNIFRY